MGLKYEPASELLHISAGHRMHGLHLLIDVTRTPTNVS